MFTIDRVKPITELDHPAEYWLNEVVKFLDFIECDVTLFQDYDIFRQLAIDQYFHFTFAVKPLKGTSSDLSVIMCLLIAKFSDNMKFYYHNNSIICEYFYNPNNYDEQY